MKNSIENLYQLDGRVPLGKALPFGLQHVLAMFVSNITPIMILAAAVGLDSAVSAALVQNCMVIAGIGTLVQLFPVWRVGSRLPIVMGISFTFLSLAIGIAGTYGMGTLIGAVIIGGLVEGLLGLFVKYWIKLIPHVVSATVVTAIGFSLLPIGANSFAGGMGAPDFGSMNNWIVGSVTLLACLLCQVFAKGFLRSLSVLVGLVVGYVLACRGGIYVKSNMVYNSQSADRSVNKFSVVCIEFSNFKVPVAGKEGFAIGTWTEFDMLSYHGFADIDLPLIEPRIAPAVDLDHMVLPAVLPFLDFLRVFPGTGYVHLPGRFHAKSLMGADGIVFFPPIFQLHLRVANVGNRGVVQKFLLHCPMKTLDLSLCLGMLDSPVDRQNIQFHEPTLKLRIAFPEAGKLRSVIGKDGIRQSIFGKHLLKHRNDNVFRA